MSHQQLQAQLAANFLALKAAAPGPARNALLAENQRLSGLLKDFERMVGEYRRPFGNYRPRC